MAFPCRPAEDTINDLAYAHLERKKPEEAIAMLRSCLKLYPASPNAHDSLADVYESLGDLPRALENCERACKLAETHADPRLTEFRKHLERVQKKANQRSLPEAP